MKGLYRSETFPNKTEAKKWAANIESQASHLIREGYQPIPNGFTLGDLINLYLKEIAPDGRSKKATVNMLNKKLGSQKLKNLNPAVLRDFVEERISEGAGGVTIAGDLSALGTILKFGRHGKKIDLDTEITKSARADLSARNINTRGQEREREPTEAELEILYSYWESNKQIKVPITAVVKLALATSMRLSEICNLTVSDIDVKNKTAKIRDRKDPRRKVGNHQTIPLLPQAWSIIEPMVKDKKEGRLFNANAKSISARFTRDCAKLKIIDLHFHDTRHKATGDLFKVGLAIPEVALLTGHKTWEQLRRYTHVKAADVHKKFKNLQ
jgi:integrase